MRGQRHAGPRHRRPARPTDRRWRPSAPRQIDDDAVQLAVLGRPNVGKSRLVNAFVGEERVIVSPISGTTRDSIDTRIDVEGTPRSR